MPAAFHEVRRELADQVFEHEGRLRKGDSILVLQIRFRTARGQTDELAPQQALRIDARVTVGGDLVESCIDAQSDGGLVFLPIKGDLRDSTHFDSGHRYGSAHFEIADIVELGRQIVVRRTRK